MSPTTWRRLPPFLALLLALALVPATGAAQIQFPIDSLEHWLRTEDFTIPTQTGARFEGDRTQRTMLSLENGHSMLVKWAKAARGGEEFNNVPRYEVAAYELQKLFLDEDEFVVPPVILRTFPVEWYRDTVDRGAAGTFDDAQSVMVAIHYWLFGVQPVEELDEDRLESDDTYARAAANLNVLTYLIDHKDANEGNVLALDGQTVRMFSVDNGVAFGSGPSDRGDYWGDLHVERLPEKTVERLRSLTREDLDRALGVLAQWRIENDRLVRMEPTENLQANRGIRKEDDMVQLGLTSREIGNVEDRLNNLLQRVATGDLEVF